jgi:hypothetical protein
MQNNTKGESFPVASSTRSALKSMRELLSKWLPSRFGASYQMGLTCFAGLAWPLWTTRNKTSIQKTFPENTLNVIHVALSHVQKWRLLMKPLEKDLVTRLAEQIGRRMKLFVPSSISTSDVGFI